MDKNTLKRRNAKTFLVVSFDLRDSADRTNAYPTAYNALKRLVGDENYFRTLKQYCVIHTDIMEKDIANYVQYTVGGNCNVSVMQLTNTPVFFVSDNIYQHDMDRLARAMADAKNL